MGGKRIEAAVVAAFLEVTEAAGSTAAVLADQQLRGEIAATEKMWQLQIEKASAWASQRRGNHETGRDQEDNYGGVNHQCRRLSTPAGDSMAKTCSTPWASKVRKEPPSPMSAAIWVQVSAAASSL